MTREEIRNLILRRLYEVVFKEGQDGYIDIRKFSESINVDPEMAFRVIDELKGKGFIQTECAGGTYEFGPAALVYCEEHELGDKELIDYQRSIRTKLLVTLAEMQEATGPGDGVHWQEWIQRANVNERDFSKNLGVMVYLGLIKYDSPYDFLITPDGIEKYDDYCRREKRLDDFEKLEHPEGVKPQERGHKLEDLLGEVIDEEGWEVDKRVRAQGQENDIIIHKGLDYFFISCKWEKEPIEPKELDIMYSRALSRKDVKGSIVVSISGFTDNCISEIVRKMESCHVLIFGPEDIKAILRGEKTFTDLIHNKYKEVMLHRRILLDGDIRDVKPI